MFFTRKSAVFKNFFKNRQKHKKSGQRRHDLGASRVSTFLKVTLPLSVPGIMSGILMVFMPTMSTFSVTEIMGGADTYMVGSMINELINGGDWGGSAAFSLILLVLVAGTMALSNLLSKGKSTDDALGGVL